MADEQRVNMESRDRAHKPTSQEMTQQRQQGITGKIDLENDQHHDTAADGLHSGEAQRHPMTQTPQQRKGQTAATETRREGGSETDSRKERESAAEKRSGGGSEPNEREKREATAGPRTGGGNESNKNTQPQNGWDNMLRRREQRARIRTEQEKNKEARDRSHQEGGQQTDNAAEATNKMESQKHPEIPNPPPRGELRSEANGGGEYTEARRRTRDATEDRDLSAPSVMANGDAA
jgi:hypothetical protein